MRRKSFHSLSSCQRRTILLAINFCVIFSLLISSCPVAHTLAATPEGANTDIQLIVDLKILRQEHTFPINTNIRVIKDDAVSLMTTLSPPVTFEPRTNILRSNMEADVELTFADSGSRNQSTIVVHFRRIAKITFEPSAPAVLPGNRVKIKAIALSDKGEVIEGERFYWTLLNNADSDFISFNGSIPTSELTITSLFTDAASTAKRPDAVPLKVTAVDEPAAINLGVVRLLAGGTPPGPIPPGLNPQVDVMWSVVPDEVVHDNFGSKISKEYYCIEVIIGNNTGYDLQVAAVGFTVPSLNPNSPASSKYIVPSSTYKMTRGSIERAQQVGGRAKSLALINTLGAALTATTPFFHVTNHRANFAQLTNIINNPLTSGYQSFYPDTIIRQLDRLEDQALRNDVTARTIVPNNTQIGTVTFIPKAFLVTQQQLKDKKNRLTPQDVMKLLGQLVLVGEQVEHINRIRVVSAELTPKATEFSIAGRITDACMHGVPNATVKLTGDPFFKEQSATTDQNGDYSFTGLPAGKEYTVIPQADASVFNMKPPATLKVNLSDNKPNINFEVASKTITISGTTKDATGAAVSGVKVEVLEGATSKNLVTTGADGTFTMTALPAGHAYSLKATKAGATFNVPALSSSNCDQRGLAITQNP